MNQECFIGIDQGSSSTKALVIGVSGEVLFRTKRELTRPFREGLRVEQDPIEVLGSVREVLEDSMRHADSAGLTVLGAGLSCQRSSCLIWNVETGETLSPVISWRDTRGTGLIDRMAGQKERVFTATGLPLTPYYSASKFRWLRDSLPAARKKTTVYGTLSSYLVQQLTNGARPIIDHTNAARTQLMDIRSLAWDPGLLDLFGLSEIHLPVIKPTAHDFGRIGTSSEDVPLLASIGDQQAAMLGLGVTNKGEGGINYGTGGFLMVNTGETLVPAPGLMASVHYSSNSGNHYLLEGSVNAVGDALEWLRVRIGLFREFDEVDDLCWKALTDVVAFIGINGTGAPHWETGISSSIHGLTADSTTADIVRAAVENIAFFMRDIADTVRAAGIQPSAFATAGGLSSLSYLVQVQADLLGMGITVNEEKEVSARGAAFLAGIQHGTWTTRDIKKMAGTGEPAEGRTNPGVLHRYGRWKELHRMTRAIDAR
ncbi:MAG: FGGY family carbohydrate kinase [Nitrospirota bacterium]